jgi:DNA mismatch repair protein MutL
VASVACGKGKKVFFGIPQKRMTITALPKATVQLLGAAQVLTTPTSLVKELIDNALDAKATSIDIVVSKNTLDKLEVRDNGHGISSEDFNCLGKRGNTSKLRSFEELKFVSGITLGFRGEALASAVQLGEVSVTTKTEGEAVATKLVFKAPGGVDQKSRVSHPVGTTVSVLKFMYNIPIRKKIFEKEAPKTLAKINQLLRSYALARPSIRLSLKITDGGKGSWSFAPRPHGGIREASSMVIGRDAAMECIEKSLTFAEHQLKDVTVLSGNQDTADPNFDLSSNSEDRCFRIEAFLPKADADVSKVGTGQYLSIDSRPVSHEKGTMKKIVTLFKKYIRGALEDSSEKLKNPFIRLNIKCPVASYDANVEPAKDDVLFGNEFVVLELAENLLKEVYGDLEPSPTSSAPKSLPTKLDDLLLARNAISMPEKSPSTPSLISLRQRSPDSSSFTLQASSPMIMEPSTVSEGLATENDDKIDEQVGNERRKRRSSMSKDFSEEADDGRRLGRPNTSVRPQSQPTPDNEISGSLMNPWIISKMTAPSSGNNATSESSLLLHSPLSEIISSSQPRSDQLGDSNTFVPSHTRPRQSFCSGDIRAPQPSVYRRHSGSANRPKFNEELFTVGGDVAVEPGRRNDFVSARDMVENALISPPRTVPKTLPRNRGSNRQIVIPLTTSGIRIAPADRLVQTTLFANNPRPRRRSDGGHVMAQTEPNQDLAWAMDFEQRKEDATRRRREEIRTEQVDAELSHSSGPVRVSPHKTRYNAAIASLEASQPRIDSRNTSEQVKVPFKTSLPDGDPRAYLMKRQKSFAAKKNGPGDQPMMMRTKSSRLPLERIPREEQLHNLVYRMLTEIEKLQGTMEKLAKEDMYVRHGGQSAGLMISVAEASLLAGKLQEAVKQWVGSGDEKKYEIEYNLDNFSNFMPLNT